jgi:hypothetical protein
MRLTKVQNARTIKVTLIVLALPIIVYSALYLYDQTVPRHSYQKSFPDLGITLRLQLYLTTDENKDSGQDMTVVTEGGRETQMLIGYDWAHYARKNIYRMEDESLAILGAFSSDYRITLKPLGFSDLNSTSADNWHYLGAFVLETISAGKQDLRYRNKDELLECIPMASERGARWEELPRPAYRQRRCPD